MLVWDKSTNRFAEFGSNQEIGWIHIVPSHMLFDLLYLSTISHSFVFPMLCCSQGRKGWT